MSSKFQIANTDLTRLLPVSVLVAVLLLLAVPAAVLADEPPDPPYAGPEKCAECHQTETEAWQNSPHAQAGEASGSVTCEACHGAYVEGHPGEGSMRLTVDSSICQDCHAETYEQWSTSLHGQAHVQCISCHLSHSQEFRLTDEALCGSCHRDQVTNFAHTTHKNANVTCTDCHTSSEATTADQADVSEGMTVPSHSFKINSTTCISCHSDLHSALAAAPTATATKESMPEVTLAGFGVTAEQNSELVAKLKTVEEANASLKSVSVTGLGVGIGIGGMLGIVFMLVCGFIGQRRAK